MKYVSPSVKETAFNCPHCGALAKQHWCSLRAKLLPDDNPLPQFITQEKRQEYNFEDIINIKKRKKLLQLASLIAEGHPVLNPFDAGGHADLYLHNTFVSECYNCKDISIWIYDKLVYPQRGEAPPANPDLSPDIRRDYDEASSILDLSPRGSAALIRLAIQKLCIKLDKPGKNLNDDIGALVADGLDPRIQKALDTVRVIGNNALHPGQIDLEDDRAIAETLFHLLNLIAEKMISEPKHVDEAYAGLPNGARKAIEERDADN